MESKLVLSRDCDGCERQKACSKRFKLVTREVGSKVYCPNGEVHLVDSGSVGVNGKN